MATYKMSFIFNQGRQGWTETFYITTSNLKAAEDATNALAKKRARMLGTGSVLEAYRLSDVTKPRQCSLHVLPDFIVQEDPTDGAWTAILSDLCAGDREYRRAYLIRGVPDGWVNWDPTKNRMAANNVAKSAFDQMAVLLINQPWQLRVISKDEADVNKRDVGALGVDAEGFVTFQIAGTTAVAGQGIRFTDFAGPDSKKLNHVFKVSKVVAGTVTTNLKATALENLEANGGGKAWHQKIVYRDITSAELMRPAKRDTGRAFFVPRGRRSPLGPSLF